MVEAAHLREFFRADAISRGAVIYQRVDDMLARVSKGELMRAVNERGFHLLESNGWYIVVCHAGAFRVLC